MGKAGGCAASQSEAISRLVSLALRSHIPVEAIVKELKGISCHRVVWQGGSRILSCADAIGKTIQWHDQGLIDGIPTSEQHQKIEFVEQDEMELPDTPEELPVKEEVVNLAGACPICGGPLKYESGCVACALNCGYSECG